MPTQLSPADRTKALRLYLHRKLDHLYKRATAPEFTGEISLRLCSKAGRPGEPRATIEEYGVSESYLTSEKSE